MARTALVPFELNATDAGYEVTNETGAPNRPTISSATKRSGAYSLRISSLPSGAAKGIQYQFANNASFLARWFPRTYLCIATLPSAENTIIELNDAAAFTTPVVKVTLDNTGVLRLYDEDGVIGSPSSALTADGTTWYWIDFEFYAVSGSATGVVRCRLDGTEFAGATDRNLSVGINNLCLGGNLLLEAQTTGEWFFDDVAVNDPQGSFQNSYPYASNIIRLKPDSAGDNNAWARGGTDSGANWSQTDEITPDDATDYVASGTLNQVDDYNVEATPAALDSGATINVVVVGCRNTLSSATGGDPRVVLRIKASASGTVEESSELAKNNVVWNTNNDGTKPSNYLLTLYDLPGASTTAWTKSTLDTMQIGARISVDDSDQVLISTLWALVDYTPSGVSDLTVSKSEAVTLGDTPSVAPLVIPNLSLSDTVSILDTVVMQINIEIAVSDAVAVADAAQTEPLVIDVAVTDAISVVDSATVSIPVESELNVSVSDAVAVSDAAQVDPLALSPSTSEAIAVGETIAAIVSDPEISASDAVSVTDTATVNIPVEGELSISVSDAIAVSDVAQVVSSTDLSIEVSYDNFAYWKSGVKIS